MKKSILLVISSFYLIFAVYSHACVGRIINIGAVGTVNESLLAELISVLLSERTGTTVNVKTFETHDDIYKSLKNEEIGIVIENTGHVMNMLELTDSKDGKGIYEVCKKALRKRLNLIMLESFGYIYEANENTNHYAPVITEDVLINFPALPRVVNKLEGVSSERLFRDILESVESGEKAERAAKDFLRKKKLI